MKKITANIIRPLVNMEKSEFSGMVSGAKIYFCGDK